MLKQLLKLFKTIAMFIECTVLQRNIEAIFAGLKPARNTSFRSLHLFSKFKLKTVLELYYAKFSQTARDSIAQTFMLEPEDKYINKFVKPFGTNSQLLES